MNILSEICPHCYSNENHQYIGFNVCSDCFRVLGHVEFDQDQPYFQEYVPPKQAVKNYKNACLARFHDCLRDYSVSDFYKGELTCGFLHLHDFIEDEIEMLPEALRPKKMLKYALLLVKLIEELFLDNEICLAGVKDKCLEDSVGYLRYMPLAYKEILPRFQLDRNKFILDVRARELLPYDEMTIFSYEYPLEGKDPREGNERIGF